MSEMPVVMGDGMWADGMLLMGGCLYSVVEPVVPLCDLLLRCRLDLLIFLLAEEGAQEKLTSRLISVTEMLTGEHKFEQLSRNSLQ